MPTPAAPTSSGWHTPDGSVSVNLVKPATGEAQYELPPAEMQARLASIGNAYLRTRGSWPPSASPPGPVRIDDRQTNVTLVAADPIGIHHVYFNAATCAVATASNAAELAGLTPARPSIDLQSLFDYVYFHVIPSPRSIYQGIGKVSNGCALKMRDGKSSMDRYWRPEFALGKRPTLRELSDQLHATLATSVRRAIEGTARAGAFLSGGLDSSTVAGLLAQVRPCAPTFTMGFEADGYDEMDFARIAARHFSTTPHEKYITPSDILGSVRTVATYFPEPFGNSSALAVYHCAKLAAENDTPLLLAGDGGDELFGGNERYAKQLVFERYWHLPSAMRKGLLEPLVASAARLTTRFPVGKVQSYIQQANVRLPDRLQSYNYLNHHKPAEVFTADFLAGISEEGPTALLREEYAASGAESAIDRMLFLDWKFTLHDNDLVKVNSMCQLAGVRVAYPMLDRDVVDLSLRLPAEWKVHRGQLRWFYKRAMQDFLPDRIINKSKHGFGLPFGVWTAEHPGLRKLSEDTLGSLATRGFFRPQFLSDLLQMHQQVHAKFYGELIWVLMTLELWFQAHTPDARL